MDARELENAKRRHARRTWKQLDADPRLTEAEKRCAFFTGYVSEAAKQAAEREWERQGAELRRREQERQRRAMLERVFFARARREGFKLVRTEGRLTWERIPSMRAPVAPRRADVRRSPRRQRAGTQRSARSPGRQDEPPPLPPAELTRLQAALHPYLASMDLAEDLDERELDAFISIGSIRLARVASRLRWWEGA